MSGSEVLCLIFLIVVVGSLALIVISNFAISEFWSTENSELGDYKPDHHFEICPYTQVSITRKPLEEEVESIIRQERYLTVNIANWFRFLDGLPPIAPLSSTGCATQVLELMRLEKHWREGNWMKYECKLIKKTDDCLAAKYVEDDEDLFIFDEDENFYLAEEFFNMKGEMKFEVVE